MQTHDQLREQVAAQRRAEQAEQADSSASVTLRTASIAPQVLASLVARYFYRGQDTPPGVSASQLVLLRIRHFLTTRFHFHHVYDTTFARRVTLRQSYNEYRSRRHATSDQIPRHDSTQPMLASSCPGWILFAEKTHPELLPFVSRTKSPQQIAGVLARHYLLPRSNALQPSRPFGTTYHATIMPCYDKKLEASRQDFEDEVTGWKEVDVVLTTGELEKLMIEEGFDITAPIPGEDRLLENLRAHGNVVLPSQPRPEDINSATVPANEAENNSPLPLLLPSGLPEPGSSSGGYLFHLLSSVAAEYHQTHPDASRPSLSINVLRNADYVEYTLRTSPTNERTEGLILFRAATCYGFRNLTNLVKKLQTQTGTSKSRGVHGLAVTDSNGNATPTRGRGRAVRSRGRGGPLRSRRAGAGAESEYDYVEVMACPSGCINGGGQLRPPASHEASTMIETEESTENLSASDKKMLSGWQGTSKDWVLRVEESYWTPDLPAGVNPVAKPREAAEEIYAQNGDQDEHDAMLVDRILAHVDQPLNLSTEYHALPAEETNGLAVQW